jgi:sulfate permease, SulP family
MSTAPSAFLSSLFSHIKNDFSLRNLLRCLPAAGLSYFLSVIFAVSFAALIFRGQLEASLSYGIGMTLYTAFVVGLTISLSSSLSGVIAIPSDRTAPILAVMVGSIPNWLPPDASYLVQLQTVTAALLLTTLLTGLTLCLFGHYKLGRLVRFIPYPVLGGFMAGAGWLLVKGAMTVLSGFELEWQTLPLFLKTEQIMKWLPALIMAGILVWAMRRWKHFLIVPGFVLGSILAFYFISILTRTPLNQLRSRGWLAGPFPDAIQWSPLSYELVRLADWLAVLRSWEMISSVLLVSAISVLMIASSLELSSGQDSDGDQELKSAGLANLLSFFGGGIVGLHSLSISSLTLRMGSQTRLTGLLAAGAVGLTLLIGLGLINYLPIPVLGGLLLFLGLNFLTEWLIDIYPKIPRSDYLIILVILIAIGAAGYITGVALGLIAALALFVLRYSQVQVVRSSMTGSEQRSNVDRKKETQQHLLKTADQIHVLTLQGFLFFGTAQSLLETLKKRLTDTSTQPLRFLILDFRHVSGMDSSALTCFVKLEQLAQKHHFHVTLSDLNQTIRRAFQRHHQELKTTKSPLFNRQPDLDHALEWAENQLLSALPTEKINPTDSQNLWEKALQGHAHLSARILRYFKKRTLTQGKILATQDQDSSSLYWIEQGQISARLKTTHGETLRLRTMGPGSIVGEASLYLKLPRTASLIADQDSIIHELTLDKLQELEKDDVEAASCFHQFLARTLADRLVQTNRMLEAARR